LSYTPAKGSETLEKGVMAVNGFSWG